MGLKQRLSNAWNPQSNAILERIHQVQGDGLTTFDLENTLIDPDEEDPFDEYLSLVVYAINQAGDESAESKKKKKKKKKNNYNNNNNRVIYQGLIKDGVIKGVVISSGTSAQMATDFRLFTDALASGSCHDKRL